jgi:hypothetical protein
MEGLRRYGGVIAGRVEKKVEVEEANGSGENCYRGCGIRSCCIAEPRWRTEWTLNMRMIRVVAQTARRI